MEKFKFFLAKRVFHRRRAEIYAQIGFALDHDANLKNEIDELHKVAVKRRSDLLPVYARWKHNFLHNSGSLANSMRGTISDSECGLIASAEETQNLPTAFKFLARAVKQITLMQESIKKAIRSTFLPGILLIALFYGIDSGFFSVIEESIPKNEWGFLPRAVASFTHNLTLFLTFAIALAIPTVVWWFWSLPRWSGKFRLYAEKTIFYNKYRDQQCAMFLMNLAFLMQADYPLKPSLERIRTHAPPYLAAHISSMLKKLNKDASNAGLALVSTGLFSPELGDLLTNYARWSNWHTQIHEIAANAMEIVTRDVLELSPRIEEGLKLTIGLVLFIVIATVGLIITTMLKKVGLR